MRMRMCIAGALVDRLLTQTLRLADLAMPIDPWRGRLWAAAPLPPLCSALTAYRSDAPGMRGLIVEAAGRLINGSERHLHPDVNPSDQTALWFAYVLSAPRTSLRILALPEAHLHVETSRPRAPDRPALQHAPPAPEQTQDGLEPRPAPTKPRPSPGESADVFWLAPANFHCFDTPVPHDQETLCAGESLGSTHVLTGAPPRARLQPFAYFRSSWVGPQQSDRRGVYRCHAVHGHGYADEQVERLLLAPEIAPVWDRGRLVGPDFVG